MKKFVLSLAVFFCNVSLAFICEITVLVNSENNKKVVLLSDVHGLQRFIKDSTVCAMHHEVVSQQLEQLGRFTRNLLEKKDAAHVVVATEISNNMFGRLLEEELGLVESDECREALLVMPKLLLRAVLKDGATLQEKVKPFFGYNTASFSLPNNLCWIAADRSRTAQDGYLAFSCYTECSRILDELEKQKQSGEYSELTIEFIGHYLQKLHVYFKEIGLQDNPYFEQIKKSIAEALSTGGVKSADLFAQLHKYLVDSGQHTERDCFNNNVIAFLSLKFDAELQEYITIFNRERSLAAMVVIAGSAHNEFLKKVLINRGYAITQHFGKACEEDSLARAYASGDMGGFMRKLYKDMPDVSGMINYV